MSVDASVIVKLSQKQKYKHQSGECVKSKLLTEKNINKLNYPFQTLKSIMLFEELIHYFKGMILELSFKQ